MRIRVPVKAGLVTAPVGLFCTAPAATTDGGTGAAGAPGAEAGDGGRVAPYRATSVGALEHVAVLLDERLANRLETPCDGGIACGLHRACTASGATQWLRGDGGGLPFTAARLAGIPKPLFLTKLADFDVDTFRMTADELHGTPPRLDELRELFGGREPHVRDPRERWDLGLLGRASA